jgi:hypothetical protein
MMTPLVTTPVIVSDITLAPFLHSLYHSRVLLPTTVRTIEQTEVLAPPSPRDTS